MFSVTGRQEKINALRTQV
jgi:hypothetical protein